jgi:hypothetical protein
MTDPVEPGRPRPLLVRVDEVVVTFGERGGATYSDVPVIFDTEGDHCIVLMDLRGVEGPVLAVQLTTRTAYAFAMNVMQVRRRLLRAAKTQPSPIPRS